MRSVMACEMWPAARLSSNISSALVSSARVANVCHNSGSFRSGQPSLRAAGLKA